MDLTPFNAPLAQPSADGWRGGVHRRPLWLAARRRVDAAGVHALLRAADLPRAELLHLGFTDGQLSASAEPMLLSSRLLLPLGRIVLDAVHHRVGGHYIGDQRDGELARYYGAAVLARWFP